MSQPPHVPLQLKPYIQAYYAKDLDALVGCFSEGAVLRLSGPVGRVQGRAAIRAYFGELLQTLDSMKLHRSRFFTLEGEVASFNELTMALPGQWAEPRHFMSIQVYRFDEAGLISSQSTFVDLEGAVRLG